LATSPSEEGKIVSVLFADLVGFTDRAESLDPEDVRALQDPYWQRVRGEIERRGGTVEKFIGDAVVALFGRGVMYPLWRDVRDTAQGSERRTGRLPPHDHLARGR
jgi:class 3 adenylate cyclase